MVPSYYVKLDSIPLTTNGKVNRKTLPMPEGTGISTNNYIAPSTATEKTLVRIWSEVLRAKEETISTQSHFFDLGGDSIKALKLTFLIKKEFNIDFKIGQLFLYPILLDVSNFISVHENKVVDSFRVRIEL